jgi:hypothetical protein
LELLATVAAVAVLIALFFPAVRDGRGAARRAQCMHNLKQIAVAIHCYHDEYCSLPPAYTVDCEGRRLHSWRTLILPYTDQAALYGTIDLSKPWDDPANAAAYAATVPAYQCPSVMLPPTHTTYLGLVGDDHFFHPDRVRTFSEFTDGTSETAMIVEVAPEHAVHWMAPQDTDAKSLLALAAKAGLAHDPGTHVALADGSVWFVSHEVSLAERRALTTVAGGDRVADEADTEPAP